MKKSKKLFLIVLFCFTLIYGALAKFIFYSELFTSNVFGAISLLAVFGFSSWIMLPTKEVTQETQTQRLFVGLSLQFILVLFAVLIAYLIWKQQFRQFIWCFMPFYGLFLFSHAIFLIIRLNRQ